MSENFSQNPLEKDVSNSLVGPEMQNINKANYFVALNFSAYKQDKILIFSSLKANKMYFSLVLSMIFSIDFKKLN